MLIKHIHRFIAEFVLGNIDGCKSWFHERRNLQIVVADDLYIPRN